MRRLSTLGPLLLLCGCFGAKDSALFADLAAAGGQGGTISTNGNGAASAHSGTDSGSGAVASVGQGGNGAGSGTGGGQQFGGSGGKSSSGEAGASGGRDTAPPVIESCSMLEGAVESELDGHCYRVSDQELSFDDALRLCAEAGGHLVNIGSAEENVWVRDLHDGEHWLGATDGRAAGEAGVGPYFWVSGEPWSYSDWEDGQPNAFATDCPDEDGGANCFEHCAFQSDEGDWNDRSCWHTIVAVCEWDLVKPDPGTHATAGAGAGGNGSEEL